MKNKTTNTAIFRRALTRQELERLRIIAETENITRACRFAGITLPTWARVYKHNGITKTTTISALLDYAQQVHKAAKKELIS